ncbi:MAG: type III secretion system export apparatus subunit SctU [Simkaniaceae bacterium]|nr:type III secretion system export apparatus subunit SctU [Simkaniaceae bacterium]MCF7852926.1 type III secretion system export apparatus subunit SctU [Simkaniaceae bacterium]
MAEKTEKATPKKLKDARKKGQVAKSKDFPSAFTFIVSISGILMSSSYLYSQLSGYMIEMFSSIKNSQNMGPKIMGMASQAIQVIFDTSIPIMVIVSCIGVLVNFLIIGPLFSMEAMKPDIKKLNPISNIKNMFKIKTFIELLKSILKITGAILLIYGVVHNSLSEIVSTAALPIYGTALVFNDFLVKVIIRVGIFFIAIGLFDLVFQKKNFSKEMKMEKFEVKQEVKDTEGDPHIKSKRRQRAQEIAYQEGPRSTARARTVITNPSTIAVAIEYDPEILPAPKIVTMGKDLVAEEIIKIALDNNIPIMRNIALAHQLYFKCKIGQFVPEDTYETIAEILKWIEELEAEEKAKEKREFLEILEE